MTACRAARAVLSLVSAAAFAAAAGRTSDPHQASEACRPCHASRRGGVFDQWLASPYSDREAGIGCQGCHSEGRLPAACRATTAALAPWMAAHQRHAVDLLVTAACRDGLVAAEVLVCNTGAGHALPSGETATALVLTVEAWDAAGSRRVCLAGPRLPAAAGDPAAGAATVYAGDVALAAFATHVTELVFTGPCDVDLTVQARLVRRRPDVRSGHGCVIDDVVAVASDRLGGVR